MKFRRVLFRTQNFDFTLPHTKRKSQKLIKAINNPTPDNYKYPLFSWMDVRTMRKNSDFIILANDTNNSVAEGFIEPFRNYSEIGRASCREREYITVREDEEN